MTPIPSGIMEFYNSKLQDRDLGGAFEHISSHVLEIIEKAEKKNESICMMCADPDNLGAAISCMFLMKQCTMNKGKKALDGGTDYSKFTNALALIKERR